MAMDLNCGRCGELWEPLYYMSGNIGDGINQQEFDDFWAKRGCQTCYNIPDSEAKLYLEDTGQSQRSEIQAAMKDMLGNDLDGVASMMDDYDFMYPGG